MKYTDLKPGNYYFAEREDWNSWVVQIKEVRGEDIDVFVSITINGGYYDSPEWTTDGKEWFFREASPEEILWIQTCLKNREFIPLNEIKQLEYEIY